MADDHIQIPTKPHSNATGMEKSTLSHIATPQAQAARSKNTWKTSSAQGVSCIGLKFCCILLRKSQQISAKSHTWCFLEVLMLCCIIAYYTILHYIILSFLMLYYIILCYAI